MRFVIRVWRIHAGQQKAAIKGHFRAELNGIIYRHDHPHARQVGPVALGTRQNARTTVVVGYGRPDTATKRGVVLKAGLIYTAHFQKGHVAGLIRGAVGQVRRVVAGGRRGNICQIIAGRRHGYQSQQVAVHQGRTFAFRVVRPALVDGDQRPRRRSVARVAVRKTNIVGRLRFFARVDIDRIQLQGIRRFRLTFQGRHNGHDHVVHDWKTRLHDLCNSKKQKNI